MTLKGKLSSFISACNELSIFIFNHQDISVKLLVKSLLRGKEGEKKNKGKTLQCHWTAQLLSNIPIELKLDAAATHCLGFHWGSLTSSSSQSLQLPTSSLFFPLPQSISKLYHLCSKICFGCLFCFFILVTDFLCWTPSVRSCHWSSLLVCCSHVDTAEGHSWPNRKVICLKDWWGWVILLWWLLLASQWKEFPVSQLPAWLGSLFFRLLSHIWLSATP